MRVNVQNDKMRTLQVTAFLVATLGLTLCVISATWIALTWGEPRGSVPALIGAVGIACALSVGIISVKFFGGGRK